MEFVYLTAQGHFKEAWELILQENPFPGVCGRVCPRPCERACNRRQLGGAIAIHAVERFLADYGRTLPRPRPRSRPLRSKQVAVVGSGPAGLSCAYHLARLGHGATVFEALPKAGGMMRVGIPRYRLPRAVLDREIADIKALGVEIRTNTLVGRDITLDQLRGFDALFIATGYQRSRRLGVPGEEAKGVFSGVRLLKKINSGEKVRIGERVAVIGGGNTAVNAARVLLRLGRRPTIICRGTRKQMPALVGKADGILEEGMAIISQAGPVEILIQGSKVKGVELVKLKPAKGVQKGRFMPVKGSEFQLKADAVVVADGELPDLSFLPQDIKAKPGGIVVSRGCLTTREGVFAGGDVVTGTGSVAAAIGSGKRTALAIDRYLKGEDFSCILDQTGTAHAVAQQVDRTVARFEDLNRAYLQPEAGISLRTRLVETRIRGFQEVSQGYREEEAMAEARRCCSCGVCNMCDNCVIFCPEAAISAHRDKFGYRIDYQRCTGCGICVQECPRNAMSMREVPK